MSSIDYIVKNRGMITSSKLKAFMECPLRYYLEYEKEISFDDEDEQRYFIMGRCLDDYLSFGEEKWLEKWTILEPRKRRQGEFDIPHAEGQLILQAIREAERQPIFDIKGGYDPRKKIRVNFTAKNGVKLILTGEMDRFSEAKKFIRDWKFYQNVEKFEKEFVFALEGSESMMTGYVVQMVFYWLLVYIEYEKKLECDFIFDVIDKKTTGVRSAAFMIPSERIKLELDRIIGNLNLLAECKKKDKWSPVPVDQRERKCLSCPMYRTCPATAIQSDFITL